MWRETQWINKLHLNTAKALSSVQKFWSNLWLQKHEESRGDPGPSHLSCCCWAIRAWLWVCQTMHQCGFMWMSVRSLMHWIILGLSLIRSELNLISRSPFSGPSIVVLGFMQCRPVLFEALRQTQKSSKYWNMVCWHKGSKLLSTKSSPLLREKGQGFR